MFYEFIVKTELRNTQVRIIQDEDPVVILTVALVLLDELQEVSPQLLSEMNPLNTKTKSKEITVLLDEWIPGVEELMTQLNITNIAAKEIQHKITGLKKEVNSSKSSCFEINTFKLDKEVYGYAFQNKKIPQSNPPIKKRNDCGNFGMAFMEFYKTPSRYSPYSVSRFFLAAASKRSQATSRRSPFAVSRLPVPDGPPLLRRIRG